MSAGASDTNAPLEKPYNAAKSMNATLPRAGNHNARTKIVDKKAITIIVLKRPIRSAIAPGIVRPKMETAFNMARR